jgi:uncharacterized protein (DUF1800 family)
LLRNCLRHNAVEPVHTDGLAGAGRLSLARLERTAARFWIWLPIHPATANFLSLKLCRRFVSDNPPKAKVWMENAKKSDQIAIVLKHIILSSEFSASQGQKPRSPLALTVSFARVCDIPQ